MDNFPKKEEIESFEVLCAAGQADTVTEDLKVLRVLAGLSTVLSWYSENRSTLTRSAPPPQAADNTLLQYPCPISRGKSLGPSYPSDSILLLRKEYIELVAGDMNTQIFPTNLMNLAIAPALMTDLRKNVYLKGKFQNHTWYVYLFVSNWQI